MRREAAHECPQVNAALITFSFLCKDFTPVVIHWAPLVPCLERHVEFSLGMTGYPSASSSVDLTVALMGSGAAACWGPRW